MPEDTLAILAAFRDHFDSLLAEARRRDAPVVFPAGFAETTDLIETLLAMDAADAALAERITHEAPPTAH